MGLEKTGSTAVKEIIAWTRTGASKSLLVTKPVKINISNLRFAPNLATDTICITNPLPQINKQLKYIYGINAQLTNLPLAKRILTSVEQFCSVNKKNDLFNGLELSCDAALNKNSAFLREYSVKDSKFTIKFNEKFDFENLDSIIKDAYNMGKIPSDNPNVLFDIQLGHFLNFRHNPTAYHITCNRNYIDKSEKLALRISDSKNMADFNANYIAGRMSGKTYPKKLYTYFEGNLGNTNLKFPKPTPISINQGSIHKFAKISDAQKYLLDNYGIEAEFVTTQQANLFAGAVDDMCNMVGNKTCFKGLKITKNKNPDSLKTQMSTHWDYATEEASMTINPAYNWKQEINLAKHNYQTGFRTTANPKDIYIHELAHWLDFKGNPVKFGEREIKFSNGNLIFNEYGKNVTSKVSIYAQTSPGEFCAEYIAGKYNGIQYPKCVDDLFTTHWNGPKLNFPTARCRMW